MQSNRQQAGVTMVELMIVVAIAAILAGLAAPSFIELINNTRMTSTMSQLTSDLNRARSEAIKRNRRMLVCGRNSASTVTTDTAGTDYCGSDTNWQAGWVVCYDENQNGYCDVTYNDGAGIPVINPIVVHQAINARLFLWRTDGNTNPNLPPITTLTIATPITTPIYFNPSGTQGAGGAVALTLAGAWTGAVTNVATIAATGNITKTP